MRIIRPMQTRTLGTGGWTIGEIGLGCWQFGGDFGPMDDHTALGILAAAVESGTDFFDTADVYGAGRSEELIGRFLKSLDHEAVSVIIPGASSAAQATRNAAASALPPLPEELHRELRGFYQAEVARHIRGPD